MIKKESWQKEIGELLSKKFVVDENGYSIFFPEHYYDLGFSAEFVDQFIEEQHSSGNHMGDIYKHDGSIRKIVVGISHLNFLYGLVGLFNLDYPPVQGRGQNANECVRVLKEFFQKQ